MNLMDIAPFEKWQELEDVVCKRSGLNVSVFDMNGTRITGRDNWVNQLCPVIKANEKGQAFICSLAHQNIVNLTERSNKTLIEECDAGLVKFVVPIFINCEMIGVVGGCGLLLPDGEVDTFLIQKTIGGDEEQYMQLSENIGTVSEEDLLELSAFIELQIDELKQNCLVGLPN
ncbi:MAG: hypothetical protein HOE30_15550 [Deltaproteobacteria bacterium]|jgi:ligand-binding sensor protein|nr:hypothetical protein [Deltaproteobacteria bacterium]MBT4089899.1 hypothetical protein [Deltaproteobacteria bacterium]MBT4268498.1 hypothetical protein [Deltaproteobacteria bacterium]MBT4644429.1 hypothetical protein [Deltaproteobacteria bacterium]